MTVARHVALGMLLGGAFWLGVMAGCAEEKPATPAQYCIVEGHALRQAIGPDPKPSDPHDVPRRICTAEDLREASPRP